MPKGPEDYWPQLSPKDQVWVLREILQVVNGANLNFSGFYEDLFLLGLTPGQIIESIGPKLLDKLKKEVYRNYAPAMFSDFEVRILRAFEQVSDLTPEEREELKKEWLKNFWDLVREVAARLRRNDEITLKVAKKIIENQVSKVLQYTPLSPEDIDLDVVDQEVAKIYAME